MTERKAVTAPKTVTERTILIPPINRRNIIVTIEGDDTPLLLHPFSERSMKAIEDKQQHRPNKAKVARDPEAEFWECLHVMNPDADPPVYGFPTSAIHKAIVTVGGRFLSMEQVFIRGAISVRYGWMEIRGSQPVMHRCMGRINGGKTWDVRYRALIETWEMDVPVRYDADLMSQDQIINLLNQAGDKIGIGDWRIELKNGQFGRFRVKGAMAQ